MQQRRNEGRGAGGRPGIWLTGALACSLAAPVFAQGKPTVEELQRRLEALEQRYGGTAATTADGQPLDLATLDQRLRSLERNLELQEEARQAKAKEAPVVVAGASGTSIKSGDGQYEFKFRGLVQGDGRFFSGDNAPNDTFLLRRLRPTFEGSLGKLVGYRLTPEFAGDSATIVDAYIDLKFNPAFTIRAGKVKGPVGLERLQSGNAIALIERAFPTELAPNRDIGVQAQGDIVEGKLNYTVGIYNGTPDGRDTATTNPDDKFEFAARLFFEPVKGIGIGVGGSIGDKEGVGNNFLPRYRSQGQQQIFNYRAAVAAAGQHTRISPQGYLYRGPFGLQAEYIESRQELTVGANRAELSNTAWQATASWVLTGEEAGYRGVRPAKPFKPDGGWGAFELVGRYGELDVDNDAFPLFADPAVAVRDASGWTVGVNWYLNSNLKLVLNYLQTDFNGGAVAGADRASEKAVFTRLQAAF
ncbi:OprO/OprP family phosphate-selective porin [Pseudoxanthomonas suwonensis]|uniref:Porin n=1 Tax=Pseudoxanthomonas suwonensis TaxID=314722 RepID=A0A0E3UME6_9GAMM|nr:porin [Pseudoxanthomonas suwonensis]AKC85970.1 porin [Pseudoxanthomonas suwonensis]